MAPVEIRRRLIAGDPIHWDGHWHEHAADDYMKTAPARIGPVAYSLLRAAIFSLRSHRETRLRAALDGYKAANTMAREIWKIDPERGARYWRMNGRLYMWDLIQIVHEVCEDLSGVFTALRNCERDRSLDLGLELLNYHRAADKGIASADFGKEDWWRRQLGIEPDPTRYALLTPAQQSSLTETLQVAGARLSLALPTVRSTYTHSLHRIAARNRHGMALLEPDQALVWVGQQDEDARADMEALAGGALAVADTDGSNLVELLMPISNDAYSDVMTCWNEATWLFQSLCGSVVERAESPAGVSIPSVGQRPTTEAQSEARIGVTVAYCGYDPEQAARQNALLDETEAVHAAVERRQSPNRAQRRRHPKKTGRR
jgi:hypothetical protein